MNGMDYNRFLRIRDLVELEIKKKSLDVRDGPFASALKGRSLDFDDLKEYTYGDNVRDIDWRSSTRAGKTLIRRYSAEKKYSVLIVSDDGRSFEGIMPSGEKKKEAAADAFGAAACIAERTGADVALMYGGDKGTAVTPFKTGEEHLMELFVLMEKNNGKGGDCLPALFNFLTAVRRRLIVILITDIGGVIKLTPEVLRAFTGRHELMTVCVEDAPFGGNEAYLLEDDICEDRFFLGNGKIVKEGDRAKREALEKVRSDLGRSRSAFAVISSKDEAIPAVTDLIKRYNNDVYG